MSPTPACTAKGHKNNPFMNKDLQQQTQWYVDTLKQNTGQVRRLAKTGAAGAAALATVMLPPVELSSQIVCGNLGAPTRTAGSCIDNLGNYYTNFCAKFDFDGDGINELQVKYYNYNGVYPFAFMYVDPVGSQFWTVELDTYLGRANFPEYPVARSDAFFPEYGNKMIIVPLSGGAGFGFIAFDGDADRWDDGTTPHATTGQPICCLHTALPSMWGGDTDITIADFKAISNDMTDCGSISPLFDTALPVELSAFTARAGEKRIQLNWETASETANSGFEVQRSLDGNRFEPLGFVNGQGDATEANDYLFEDRNVDADTEYFYRLKQINFDGSFNFSSIVSAQVIGEGLRTSVFPNPVAGGLVQLSINTPSDAALLVTAYNGVGQVMRSVERTVQAGRSQIELDIQDFAPGVYYLKLQQAGETTYEKVVVD